MTVPAETLFALTAVFFIREVCIRSKQKHNDFDTGYKQALKDISERWNWLIHKELSPKDFLDNMRMFLQNRLNDFK